MDHDQPGVSHSDSISVSREICVLMTHAERCFQIPPVPAQMTFTEVLSLMQEEDAKQIICQLMDGLEFCHVNSIYHRYMHTDIKTALH